MAIITKKTYELPSEGLHNAQITRADVAEQVPTAWGPKDKVRVIFSMLDENGKDGLPLEAMISVNQDLGSKSSLTKLLSELKLTAGDTFDTNAFIGVKTQVIISHKEEKERTYARVTIVPSAKAKTVEV
jgi:hypothetical protein